MRRVWSALAAVVIAAVALVPGAAADAVTGPLPAAAAELSGTGKQAIADLRTCLASNDVLNVYYLIDSSGSLAFADDGGPGSDPDFRRAEILANSLEQLGRLGRDTTVNWAAGFFSTHFDPGEGIDWRPWQEGGSGELDQAIRSRAPGGYTNWPEALAGAQGELAAQQAAQPGCQLLVWLTDGELDTRAPDGPGPEDRDALNQLCGGMLDDSGAQPSGYGIFDSFRQSQVVVVGALLGGPNVAPRAAPDMRALVEGLDPGSARACGRQPVPDDFVRGVFVEADSPDSLAIVFRELAAQLGGGYPHPFESDGSFWIVPGIARFQILVTGEWTLHPPADSGLEAATSTAPPSWLTWSEDDGVIEVATTDAATHGEWRLEAGDVRSLFLFSDLQIVFTGKNDVSVGLNGVTGTLRAQVYHLDGSKADLTDFVPGTFSARLKGSDTALPDADVEVQTGAISIPLPADVTALDIEVEASIDPLTTKERPDLHLAPLTTRDLITIVLPSGYPRLPTDPVELTTLKGRNGVAEGVITVAGPESGGDGRVCLGEGDIAITSDQASRASGSWTWAVGGAGGSEVCLAVPVGGEVEIPISVTNREPADADVRATASIRIAPADDRGQVLTQDVPIVFSTTHPVNNAAILVITLVLLALSILIPLFGLWLINRLTTRLDIDRSIQRASFPVRIAPDGVVFTDAPASDTALSERFRYRGEARRVRSLDDPDLGRIRAIVPWFPLRAPKYGVSPTGDRVVIAARTGALSASSGERRPDGSMRFAHLPFEAFWAIVATRAELRRTERGQDVSATAVLYHRETDNPSQYRDRLADISRDRAVADAVDRARAALAERDAARTQPAKGADRGWSGTSAGAAAAASPGAAPARPTAAAHPGATPPPRPGETAGAPDRPGGPPPRPGSPPPSPHSTPPGTAGGPLPRPGSR